MVFWSLKQHYILVGFKSLKIHFHKKGNRYDAMSNEQKTALSDHISADYENFHAFPRCQIAISPNVRSSILDVPGLGKFGPKTQSIVVHMLLPANLGIAFNTDTDTRNSLKEVYREDRFYTARHFGFLF